MQNSRLACQSWSRTMHVIPLNQNIYRITRIKNRQSVTEICENLQSVVIINDNTLLLMVPGGEQRGLDINGFELFSTIELLRGTWDLILHSNQTSGLWLWSKTSTIIVNEEYSSLLLFSIIYSLLERNHTYLIWTTCHIKTNNRHKSL